MDQDATYYQEHKDDDEDWGEPEAPPAGTSRRRLDSMISVRLSPGEVDEVRQSAAHEGLTVSAFVRACVLAASRRGLNNPASIQPLVVTLNNYGFGSSNVPGVAPIGWPQRSVTSSVA